MDLKAHALFELNMTREMLEGILMTFQNEGDWFYQPHPQVNHALWITAHLALVDNMFLSQFDPEKGKTPDGWNELFGFGSVLVERDQYPSVDTVLGYFRDRRAVLLEVIESLTEADLNAPAPTERSPIVGAPNKGHLLLFASRHEAQHLGQLTVLHRGLGHPPMIQPGPAPTEESE